MSKITNEFRSSALRRGILVKTTKGSSTDNFAFAAAIELANLGFVVSPQELTDVSNESINATITEARKIMGADRDMVPVYPGFPKQVQELSTMTLLMEQILHYWSAGTLLPDYPSIVRDGLPVADMLRNARNLRVMSASVAARELVESLVSNPVALSDSDKDALEGALTVSKPVMTEIVETVKKARNSENIQSFVRFVRTTSNFSSAEIALAVIPVVGNSDALLRVLLMLLTRPVRVNKDKATTAAEKEFSGRGVKLEYAYEDELDSIRSVRFMDKERFTQLSLGTREKTLFDNYVLAVDTLADRHSRAVRMAKVPRSVRRAVVEKLGKVTPDFKADALVNRQNLWRKVMTAIHPYDFTLSESEKRAVDIIHSNVDYRTLNSMIEEAMAQRNVVAAVTLLSEHQPGNLLRRLVALMRLVNNSKEAKLLAKSTRKAGVKASLTTLISAYNGVISANDESARVTRVAGINNTMVDRSNVVKVDGEYVQMLGKALKKAIKDNLATKDAPTGEVSVKSTVAVPLVRRDAATTDREMARGEEIAIAGEGDTLRIFSHWNNNQKSNGYMDIGLVILDGDFSHLGVITWNSWSDYRNLGTYSGDKNVYPGGSASEYFDLDLAKVRLKFPSAIYVAMTIQSWSGWPTSNVDIIAGAMLRSEADSGEVFDARSVNSAFKPTTDSTQSVPLAVDLRSGSMVWVDSSNGSNKSGISSTNDDSIGALVYDELGRPRLTLGELATLWAKAHGAETVNKPVDQDALLKLL